MGCVGSRVGLGDIGDIVSWRMPDFMARDHRCENGILAAPKSIGGRIMKSIIATVLATSIAGSASAETFRFPADARGAYGVPQVDIAFTVYMAPECAGRWALEYPSGFTFHRGGPDAGNLYGNPGRGSYDVALKTQACATRGSDYVDPARTTWHKVIVY